MRLRWMYSYMTDADRIIRRIYGNMASREAEWCLTSAWGADAKGPRSFWDSSKAFYRPTAMSPTKEWAGRSWCMPISGGGVVFDFCLGRGREGPKEFLGQFEGILQTDGYVAYERVGGAKLVHADIGRRSGV